MATRAPFRLVCEKMDKMEMLGGRAALLPQLSRRRAGVPGGSVTSLAAERVGALRDEARMAGGPHPSEQEVHRRESRARARGV